MAKILKNVQNSNSKTVLESVLVTDSKNGFKFKFFLNQKYNFGYPKMPKNVIFGTQKMPLLMKKI